MLRNQRSAWIGAWLTTLAVLWSALMPALTQTSRSADGFLGSICTSAGLKWVKTTDQDLSQRDTKPGSEYADSGHCIWCSAQPLGLHPNPSVVPVFSLSYLVVQPHPVVLPKAYLIPWAIAPPRAPPALA